MESHAETDYGDFPTPIPLTIDICNYIKSGNFNPEVIIEPTCGDGNFVFTALETFPFVERIYCIEIQEKYETRFRQRLQDYEREKGKIKPKIDFYKDNLFLHQFDNSLFGKRVLIIGNPPWVTNKELSTINSFNLPLKQNFKKLNGLDALTGKSNFDIAESMILGLLNTFKNTNTRIAMLCKTVVIRNIIEHLPRCEFKIHNIQQLNIDEDREFGVATEAGVFVADMDGLDSDFVCSIRSLYQPKRKLQSFGWHKGKFVSDIQSYEIHSSLDGRSVFEWRQGIKHDAANVFILFDKNGHSVNGFGERVDVEKEIVYPFLKGSELRTSCICKTDKSVIVTQKSLKDDTSKLSLGYPKVWSYLSSKSDILRQRKSRIYINRPQFSIFGIGDYSFASYKIGIAGMYKKPQFALIMPVDGKPVMLDDTSYFLGFDLLEDAFFVWILLNTEKAKKFLSSISFTDSQRPYTKEVLMRIDLLNLIESMTFEELQATYSAIRNGLDMNLDEEGYYQFVSRIRSKFAYNSVS